MVVKEVIIVQYKDNFKIFNKIKAYIIHLIFITLIL